MLSRQARDSLEPGAWSGLLGFCDVWRSRVGYQMVRRQTLAVSLVQTNRSLRNVVTRGDCECHAKLATFFICAVGVPSSGLTATFLQRKAKAVRASRDFIKMREAHPLFLISISRKIFCTNAAKEKKNPNEAPHLSSLSCVWQKS